MDDHINISLDTNLYQFPTEKDIRDGKRFVRMRNQNAETLSDIIEELIQDAAREITLICYKYNIQPEMFQYSANKSMQKEVYGVLDDLEDEIYDLVQQYSLGVTNDKDRRNMLFLFLIALKSKSTNNLRETLHARLAQFAYDLEAQIAAMKLTGQTQAMAVTRILSTLHSVYATPEMQRAYKKKSAARYIKSKGIHYGNAGLSSSGAVNVENFGRQTVDIVWMKAQLLDFQEKGAAGYVQLRGSEYPCDICDAQVGFHTGDWMNEPFPHAHCMCYRVPIYYKSSEQMINDTIAK